MNDRQQLRNRLCRQRLDLPAAMRTSASNAIVRRIQSLPIFHDARHIAVYSAIRGEIDLHSLWHADTAPRHWYLPVISPGSERAMRFVRHRADDVLQDNYYGIPEPDSDSADILDPRQLDLVLTPLVAFDAAGNRIGMGAGYYDRAFAFLQASPEPTKPELVGIGYEFQQVESIQPRPWDVPLSGVVTEQAIHGDLIQPRD